MNQRRRVRDAIKIVLLCVTVAVIYPVLSRQFQDPVAILNTVLIGFFGGLGIAIHQDKLMYNPRVRTGHPMLGILLVAMLYTIGFAVLVVVVVGFTRGLETRLGFVKYLRSDLFREFITVGNFRYIVIWALGMSAILSFTLFMRAKVAGNVLYNLIFGKYASPREEHRAIMYIDLNNATTIAEQFTQEAYFSFLNDFYTSITPAILMSDGVIYRYVGDQMAVSWHLGEKFDASRCIGAVFKASHLLEQKREYFVERYGKVPTFKAALHCGKIVVGELGYVKSQLVYHGDVLYVTELIEKSCRKYNKNFLVSEALIDRMDMPALYEREYCGDLSIGEGESLRLYSIREKVMYVPN